VHLFSGRIAQSESGEAVGGFMDGQAEENADNAAKQIKQAEPIELLKKSFHRRHLFLILISQYNRFFLKRQGGDCLAQGNVHRAGEGRPAVKSGQADDIRPYGPHGS